MTCSVVAHGFSLRRRRCPVPASGRESPAFAVLFRRKWAFGKPSRCSCLRPFDADAGFRAVELFRVDQIASSALCVERNQRILGVLTPRPVACYFIEPIAGQSNSQNCMSDDNALRG